MLMTQWILVKAEHRVRRKRYLYITYNYAYTSDFLVMERNTDPYLDNPNHKAPTIQTSSKLLRTNE